MKKWIGCLILFYCFSLTAAEEYYAFSSSQDKERFTQLTTELRCVVCQNQNLAESNATLANDLRTQIYQKILHGESNQQIIDYLVKRYGEFILYKPPLNLLTLGLWITPILLFVFGIGFLFFYILRDPGESS